MLVVDALWCMMQIANVCHVCCTVQGSELSVMTLSSSFSPSQHSGDAVHRAPAPATDAAGQWLVVVATPNVLIALPAAPVVDGATPAGLVLAGVPPGAA